MTQQVIIAGEGLQGPPGVNWRDDVNGGDYDPTASYKRGDGVYLAGSSYRCLKPCQGVSPPDPDFWKPVSLGGSGSGTSLSQTLWYAGL